MPFVRDPLACHRGDASRNHGDAGTQSGHDDHERPYPCRSEAPAGHGGPDGRAPSTREIGIVLARFAANCRQAHEKPGRRNPTGFHFARHSGRIRGGPHRIRTYNLLIKSLKMYRPSPSTVVQNACNDGKSGESSSTTVHCRPPSLGYFLGW